MPDHDGGQFGTGRGDHVGQVGDLMFHRERPVVGARPAVPSTVVASDDEAVVETTAQLQQAGGTVEGAVHHHHVGLGRLRGPCRGQPDTSSRRSLDRHDTDTNRMTSAAVSSDLRGEPASTTTVSPGSTMPARTTRSTAYHTISSVDP